MSEYSDRIQDRELDPITAIALAQEIARELSLERLLDRLLEILRQTTKARRICLLETQGDRWLHIAANGIGANETKVLPSASSLEISTAIINYVAQTKQSLILNDAVNEGEFVNESDIVTRQTRSVLCVPLLELDFSGVLYLENNSLPGAFTPQLLNHLQIITTQTAIAISNARQHQQLTDSVGQLEREISDREAALQASQAELAGILDIAKDGIISVDSSQSICRFNQGAEKIFGYKAEEVLGKSLDLLLPKRAVETHHQHIKDFGNKSVAPSRMMGERRSVYGRRQDGTEFPAEASISKFKLGQQQIYTAILRDISDRKEVEADLQRAKEAAESANRAKSEFLANMSHELRTPLNAILGFTQLMTRDSSLKASQQEHLSIVGRSGEHLLDLINDILTMSKIEAGLITLNENSFDLYWLLDSLEEMLRLRAESKGLQLVFEIDPEVPQYINSDESKLRQVLINLLGNGIKFTQVGLVKLRVGIKGEPSNSEFNLQFEVEDTGAGIALEEIDKLFQAFGQTDTGRKSQEGTGLGLSISRQFVRLLSGDITIGSTLNRGTLVSFDIQATLAEATDIPSKGSPKRVIGLAPDQPEYRILVVEDKLASRQLLVKLLESVGFSVREAENGQQAIAEWQSWSPHLIWMDMRMPVMDGYEATQRIKETTEGQNTKILALTASAFEEEKAIILSAGCDDFVRKPFKEEVLFDKMTEHLGVQYLYAESNQNKSDAARWAGSPT
ncbi:MAG: response regulator [Cyanobacteria bacterium J06629_2]